MARKPALSACRTALIGALAASNPCAALDDKGYVREITQNLVEGVRLSDFEADLRQGDGNELETKFRAARSSSALAVNAFAPFKSDPGSLILPVGRVFNSLSFEHKCPHGLKGRRTPNLDVVAVGVNEAVAIESKCLEFLAPQIANFSPAYEAEILDERRQTAWFQEMRRLVTEPQFYRWLDAAQLVKHAFGIARTFRGRRMTLLYLFWEPCNPETHPVFEEHRAELARFSESISGGSPDFAWMSYPELWELWDTPGQPEWLRTHVGRLKSRYAVVV